MALGGVIPHSRSHCALELPHAEELPQGPQGTTALSTPPFVQGMTAETTPPHRVAQKPWGGHPSCGRPADYLPSGTVGQWPRASCYRWNERRGGDKTDQVTQGADSALQGWQPKETASQLPQQGGTLKSAWVASLNKVVEVCRLSRQLLARSGRPAWEVRPSYSSSTVASVFYESQQLKDQHPEEVAGQLFLQGKKQRVVNIVTVAWLATAGLRGGQILEASTSTCSASQTLLPSASAAPPPGFKTV